MNNLVYVFGQVRFSTSIAMKRATTARCAAVYLCDVQWADGACTQGSSHFQKHSENAFNAKVAAEVRANKQQGHDDDLTRLQRRVWR